MTGSPNQHLFRDDRGYPHHGCITDFFEQTTPISLPNFALYLLVGPSCVDVFHVSGASLPPLRLFTSSMNVDHFHCRFRIHAPTSRFSISSRGSLEPKPAPCDALSQIFTVNERGNGLKGRDHPTVFSEETCEASRMMWPTWVSLRPNTSSGVTDRLLDDNLATTVSPAILQSPSTSSCIHLGHQNVMKHVQMTMHLLQVLALEFPCAHSSPPPLQRIMGIIILHENQPYKLYRPRASLGE